MLKQSLLNLLDGCLYVVSLKLTFAGIHAFEPPVHNVSVPASSAVLVPSTAGSATTGSARFFERAALLAHHKDHWFDGSRAD